MYIDLKLPCVMGILNVTPDSFYAASRAQTEREIVMRAIQIAEEGGTIIDIGACSARPGSTPATEEEETERLRFALRTVRHELPEALISVDTFRPAVARMAVEEYGANIINDVSDPNPITDYRISDTEYRQPATDNRQPASLPMFREVARLGVPYILMSAQADIDTMKHRFERQLQKLRTLGVEDVILDPGFGFGKTMEQNYAILNSMEQLNELHCPILVGFSRKSMIYKRLGISSEDALNGTTVLNTIALQKGAKILRVHDVREAVETVTLSAS